jgi:DNA invertase Pin-like site-specific DNA recombinase
MCFPYLWAGMPCLANPSKAPAMARAALYLRVSTSSQTVENQRRELERWATRAGHAIVATHADHGISGTKGRDRRPGLDRALKDAALHELRGAGVGLFPHQQGLDTTTPAGKAMLGMLAVFGELEAAIIKERVNAGLARAKAQGKKLGRPRVADTVEDRIRELRASGLGIKAIAKQLDIGVGTVQRVDKAMKAAA